MSDAALRDPLTGLANQRLFDDRLAHALRLHVQHSVPVSVFTVSVNDFKLVNDTLGYGVGDELLRGVGERIQANVDDSHTVARMSGDEFAVLVEDRPDVAAQVANGLARSFEEPMDIEDHRLDACSEYRRGLGWITTRRHRYTGRSPQTGRCGTIVCPAGELD